MLLAEYQCLNPMCNHKWEMPTKPADCPICGHHYVKWINYEEMRKFWNRNTKQEDWF